jgi:hypothetical protein
MHTNQKTAFNPLKSPEKPSSSITSSTASSSSLSCQKSSSNIAFTNFTKSSIKNCLPTLLIFYQRLVTEITSAPKICLPASSIFHQRLLSKIINLHQRLPTNFSNPASQKFAYQLPSKIAHKLQLSQLVGPCLMIMIIFFFLIIMIIHVLLSNISFWVSRFGKSSCCSPLPFQVHHHHQHHQISLPSFQAKIQALKNPIHGFCADWVGGWEGGWVGCRAHTDYN